MKSSTLITDYPAQKLQDELNAIKNEIASLKETTQKPEYERPISVKQAAEFLGVAESTIRNKMKLKQLPHYPMFEGTKFVFFESELVEYIKTGRVKTLKEINAETAKFVENL